MRPAGGEDGAPGLLVRAGKRARTALRERVQRLGRMGPPIVQCALAAALAWLIAADVLGHPRPFFAPIAVVLCVGAGMGQRIRRVVELVVGVSVGIGVGDLLVSVIGTGAWQIALVVALAMTVAVFLDAGALITLQAGSSAVLVATLLPPGGREGPDRMLDALIGGLLGLAAIALFSGDPTKLIRPQGRRLFDELALALTGAADAVRQRDPQLAEEALERARGTQQAIDEYRAALTAADEVVSLSPVRRRRRRRALERYTTAAEPLDHALRNARVLLRRTASALHSHEPVPDFLATSLDRLAHAAAELGRELAEQRDATAARASLEETAALLVTTARSGFSTQVVAAQARSVTVDLLQATGLDFQDARAALPPVAGEPPKPGVHGGS
ncbi:aromatic acid exporter family protein [Actinomadura vinacea]|uniref:Aromatic acid exporter family protein n=1 Tax=Actinomadura vinacea TaxID=115336 RepID=A0ABN3IN95_9ACTN